MSHVNFIHMMVDVDCVIWYFNVFIHSLVKIRLNWLKIKKKIIELIQNKKDNDQINHNKRVRKKNDVWCILMPLFLCFFNLKKKQKKKERMERKKKKHLWKETLTIELVDIIWF